MNSPSSLRLLLNRSTVLTVLLAAMCACGESRAQADEADLVAHWPLRKDARDVGPNHLHGGNRGVRFEAPGLDDASESAHFDGRGAHLSIPSAEALQRGDGDFTVALWAHTDPTGDAASGDLVSQYDPVRRFGFHLSLRTNSGVTTPRMSSTGGLGRWHSIKAGCFAAHSLPDEFIRWRRASW